MINSIRLKSCLLFSSNHYLKFGLVLFFLTPFCQLFSESIIIDNIEFIYRVPNKPTQIMVLFGGRNWQGGKTLKTYNFDNLADKHGLILLSPTFVDNDYHVPEKWSGSILKKAISKLEKLYNLKSANLYFYGYSAGGQCATLFYDWMPENVKAWGVHACGVYPEKIKNFAAPALITCGKNDSERLQISRQFIYNYRESGGNVLWKIYDNGHELNAETLQLAKAWFDAILSNEDNQLYGEDDSFKIQKNIDIEFRNPLYNSTIQGLWQK